VAPEGPGAAEGYVLAHEAERRQRMPGFWGRWARLASTGHDSGWPRLSPAGHTSYLDEGVARSAEAAARQRNLNT
jgi:hypothetical protein